MANTAQSDLGDQGFVFPVLAAALLDRQGVITRWSEGAARLLGRTPSEVLGRPFADLLAPGRPGDSPDGAEAARPSGRVLLRPVGAEDMPADLYPVPLYGAADETLLVFAPARQTGEWGYGVSLLRALLEQRELGVVLHEPDLRVALTNVDAQLFGGAGIAPGERPLDVAHARDALDAERTLMQVMSHGEGQTRNEQRMRSPSSPGREWYLSWLALRLADAAGQAIGAAAIIDDVTERVQARRHRDLMQRAASQIGLSLDPRRTAQELADVAVDGFGELATVDLAAAVLLGEEPAFVRGGDTALVRAAVSAATGSWPAGLLGPDEDYPALPESSALDRLQQGEALRLTRAEVIGHLGGGELAELMVPFGAHSAAVAPLWARGLLLGTVTVWRKGDSPEFDDADLALLSEVGSRAALGIDNGRRFTRERDAAITLQRRLMPQANVTTSAAESAGTYRPAGGGTGVSGDWFDTISLPSLRTACVVGDVVGHGLSAAATMGRLRTAVQTFADLELDPGEVLARLEVLVQRLAAEGSSEQADTVGASCLYAVYDATTGECTAASAGHPPPVLCRADGTTEVVDVGPGPPLGVGGEPYPSTTFRVPPDSVIALYTDGLFELDSYSADGPGAVARELSARRLAGEPLSEIGPSMLDRPRSRPQRDDTALLLVRPKPVDPAHIVGWQFEPRPDSVAQARSLVLRQLRAWDHEDLGFTTELVVSELVTNAIRHAAGCVELRLILDRDQALICEVTDASNTQPRLRRATETDEGGRGLFIVAQCTTRWGCRYRREGKTIWTEQPLTGSAI